MNATALSLWQVRVLAVALAIVGAGIMSLFMTSDAYAVADTLNTQTYGETGTADGTVDTITLTFDATVLACVYDAADWTINTAGTINVTAITALSCSGSNGIVLLTVTTTADITGGGTEPVISYANAGTANSLMDSGVITAKASKTVSDLAKPQFSLMSYKDNATGDGKVDRISVAFTESVVAASVLRAADLTFTGVGDFTSLAFGADATDLITGTISTLNIDVGTASTVQDTNDGAGTLAVSTQANFRLDDATGNSNTTLGAQAAIVAITDAAKPVAKTWTYSDADGDGKVDTLVAAYTESVVAASVIALNDITLTGVGDFTALAAGSTSTDLITGTVSSTTFTMGTESSVQDTEENAGTLAISTQNAFSLVDAASNTNAALGAQATISGTFLDGAKPVITTFTYKDSVSDDGKIDTIMATFSEEVVAGSVLTPAGLAFSAVGDFTAAAFGTDTTDSIAGTVTTATLTLGTASTAKDTAEGAGTIAITSDTATDTFSLVDTATSPNTNTTLGAQSVSAVFADGAAPQISTITYSDADGDAKIDTLALAYTETVTAASVLRHADIVVSAVGDFTALAAGAATTDLITGSVASTTITMGTESSAVDTNDAAGTPLELTSQANFSLTDGTNTNTDLEAQVASSAALADGAAPMLVTSSPASAATGVLRNATIVLTYSEPISTGSFAWTKTNGPSTTNFSSAWTSSNAVLTLTPLGLLSPGSHTVTVTAAPDPSSNTFAGALAAIANPFTFSVIGGSTSTSTSGSTAASYDLTVTAPDGGETLVPGETTNITWTSSSTNGSAMGFANINLMYTVDGSTVQETLVSGTANDGVYAWTVPDIDTDTAVIQIVGTDLVEALATDASDEYFSISGTATTDDTSDEAEDDTSSEVDTPSTGETGLSPVTGEVEEISVVSLGDYVRSPYFNTVYFIDADEDGTLIRRPFMDAQTFMTWQSTWDDVGTVTDATLPTMELGGPMLPKAGIVLIKIQSDARVFAIEGDNTIRWITSESVAIANYGSNWADYVIDVAPTLMSRFSQGDDVDSDENGDTGIMKTRAVVNM